MDYREISEIRDDMRIDWDMPITMDDGVVLRCDVYRPVAEGRYPVIMTYGPYGKWLHFEDLYTDQWRRMCADQPDVPTDSTNKYQNWEVVDPEKWVPDGYVVIRVDSRGAGRSQGVIDIWSLREAQDLALCVDWAGVQPWSNGKVGLNGISYYAENQWQCAALQPKHLAAICPWEGAADFYRDMAHHGGIFCRGFVAGLVEGAGLYGAERPRQTRLQEPHERRLGVRPGDAVGRRARQEPPRLLRGLHRAQARHRRLLAVAHAGLEQGQGADLVDRELGRAGPASARQFRGLRARGLEREMAGSARHRALDAFLHQLRPRPAEEVLRLFPQGRGHRLGPAAEGAVAGAPSGREIRRAARERMAAGAHAMDQVPYPPRRPHHVEVDAGARTARSPMPA